MINFNPIFVILCLFFILLVSQSNYNSIIIIITILSFIYVCNILNIVTFNQFQDIFLKCIDIIYDYHPVSKFNSKKNIEDFKNKLESKDGYNSIQLKELFNLVPPLAKYENLESDIENFVLNIDIDNLDSNQQYRSSNIDSVKNKHYITEMKKIIAYIYHYSYYTVKDEYYPQHNYMESLKSQKKLLNLIHNFIYLDLSCTQDDEMNRLLNNTIDINKELSDYLINYINNKNDLQDIDNKNIYSFTSMIPKPNEPEPIDLYNDSHMLFFKE